MIGRVAADPDFLPRRSKDFGLDEAEFLSRFCSSCPMAFFKICCMCCNTDPDLRSVSREEHLASEHTPGVVLCESYQ